MDSEEKGGNSGEEFDDEFELEESPENES